MRFYCDTEDSNLEEVKKFQRELTELISNYESYMEKLFNSVKEIKVPDELEFIKSQLESRVLSIKRYYENMSRLNKDTQDYLEDIINDIKELENEIEKTA